jgi:hypothetical protein
MTVEAFHFLREDGCLNHPPHTKVEPGITLKFDGRPILCHQGYHASERAIDALNYAPGPILCCVVLGGTVVRDTDKLVATERTVLWMADATQTLHEFACDQAEAALDRAKVNDARCRAAIETKRRWLRGEASDSELDAARDAAWDAANDALTRRLMALAPKEGAAA